MKSGIKKVFGGLGLVAAAVMSGLSGQSTAKISVEDVALSTSQAVNPNTPTQTPVADSIISNTGKN